MALKPRICTVFCRLMGPEVRTTGTVGAAASWARAGPVRTNGDAAKAPRARNTQAWRVNVTRISGSDRRSFEEAFDRIIVAKSPRGCNASGMAGFVKPT